MSPLIDAPKVFAEAILLHRGGQLQDALELYEQVARVDPRHFDALRLMGVLHLQRQEPDRAAPCLVKAIEIAPATAAAHLSLAVARQGLGQWESAAQSYSAAIGLAPEDPDIYFHRANALRALRRFDNSIADYDMAISLRRNYPEAFVNRGNALMDIGRRAAAIASYQEAIRLKPDFCAAHYNLGNALKLADRLAEAVASYENAISADPSFALAYNNCGVALRALGRAEEAVAKFNGALAQNPRYSDAFNNRGVSLRDLGRRQLALESFDAAIALNPGYLEARRNRIALLLDLRDFDAALADCDIAIQADPAHADTHNSRAIALRALRRNNEAVAALERAIALRPDDPATLGNQGLMLAEIGRVDEGIQSLRRAMFHQPDDADTQGRLATILQEAERIEEAIPHFAKAKAIDPEAPFIAGALHFAKMQVCDWTNYHGDIADIIAATSKRSKVISPFAMLSLTDSGALQRRAAETWIKSEVARTQPRPRRWPESNEGRVRIAYISADFRGHAMANLMIDVFRRHDRSLFETTAFMLSRAKPDAMTESLRSCFDHFLDVSDMPDAAAVRLCRERKIDVAVDLMGLTKASRPDLFALGMAPVQIGFLGFPGSMGADFMDYIIADEIVAPLSERSGFAEKVIHLPHSYYPTSHRSQGAQLPPTPSRERLGLPAHGFVFCGFNNAYKINPATFDIWMRLLAQLDRSVLWLLEDRAVARDNLCAQARQRGVDPARLVFASREPWLQHVARYRAADLFLDTLPYNAHTTGTDALWAGLPVLTQRGNSFAGRVAASLLTSVGLPELIADTPRGYEAMAMELAMRPTLLAATRAKLAQNLATSALFDTESYTRNLESALLAVHTHAKAGLPPSHLRVAAI